MSQDAFPLTAICEGCGQPSIFAIGTGLCGPCMVAEAVNEDNTVEKVKKQAARDILEWGQHKPSCNARTGTLCDCRFTIVEANARKILGMEGKG